MSKNVSRPHPHPHSQTHLQHIRSSLQSVSMLFFKNAEKVNFRFLILFRKWPTACNYSIISSDTNLNSRFKEMFKTLKMWNVVRYSNWSSENVCHHTSKVSHSLRFAPSWHHVSVFRQCFFKVSPRGMKKTYPFSHFDSLLRREKQFFHVWAGNYIEGWVVVIVLGTQSDGTTECIFKTCVCLGSFQHTQV